MYAPEITRPSHTAELLKLAFAEGLRACEECGGYDFVVTMKAGAVFEGAPTVTQIEDVGHVLALTSGHFIVAHEIAAIEVRWLS